MFDERDVIAHKLEEIPEKVFVAMGLDLNDFSLNGEQIRGIAPCHDDADNPTAFCYYHDSGRWFCFSNGCEKEYGSDLLGLIRAVKKCSYKEAITLAKSILEDKADNQEVPLGMIAKKMMIKNPFRMHVEQEVFSDDVLKRLSPAVVFAKQRGLDYGVISKMGAGLATKGAMNGRLVFPIRNLKSQIVGFTARKVNDEQLGPKWIHLPDTFRKNVNLFNISRAQKDIIKHRSVFLVEGPFDVVKLEMAGFYNVVALLGTTLSDEQIGLLAKLGVIEVYVGLDNDEPGKEASVRIAGKLEKNLYDQYIVQYQCQEKDWGEMSIEQIKQTLGMYNEK